MNGDVLKQVQPLSSIKKYDIISNAPCRAEAASIEIDAVLSEGSSPSSPADKGGVSSKRIALGQKLVTD